MLDPFFQALLFRTGRLDSHTASVFDATRWFQKQQRRFRLSAIDKFNQLISESQYLFTGSITGWELNSVVGGNTIVVMAQVTLDGAKRRIGLLDKLSLGRGKFASCFRRLRWKQRVRQTESQNAETNAHGWYGS